MLCISAIIMSLGVAGSQTSPIIDQATTGAVIGTASGLAGAFYENSGNPTSPQAIEDYAIGAAGDAIETGAVVLTKEMIIKAIISKGAEAYVAARAAGDYAAAEAIKAAAISEASAAGFAFSAGAFLAAVAAAVVVGVLIPAHTDLDPCDIDPSKCAGIGTPLLPPPNSDTSLNEGTGVSEIGEPLIGGNNPEKAPTEAEFPRPYDPDLPCI
jgi:hypothetical protein